MRSKLMRYGMLPPSVIFIEVEAPPLTHSRERPIAFSMSAARLTSACILRLVGLTEP